MNPGTTTSLCQRSFLTSVRHVKQTGMGSFAVVVVAWSKASQASIENSLKPSEFPPELFPAFCEGVKEIVGEQSVRAVLVDAVHHPVDSRPSCFRIAGRLCSELAAGRFSDLEGPGGYFTSEELRRAWEQRQVELKHGLAVGLDDVLDGFSSCRESMRWSRDLGGVTQELRWQGNASRVPSNCDLILGFSSPQILQFLGTDCWRIPFMSVLGEFGYRRLSNLGEGKPWKLDAGCLSDLLTALRRDGFPFLERFRTLEELAGFPGYLSPAIRGTLYAMTGREDQARQFLKEQETKRLGNPILSKAMERIVAQLDST